MEEDCHSWDCIRPKYIYEYYIITRTPRVTLILVTTTSTNVKIARHKKLVQ